MRGETRMKRIISCIIALCLILALVPAASAASAATVSLSASASSVIVGDKVSFYINFSGSNIGAFRYALNYDAERLEFVSFSGSGEGNGTGGVITVVGDFDSNVSSVKTTVTFKTKKAGQANVSVQNIQVVDGNTFSNMTVSGSTTKSITVNPKPEASTDNTIKSLTVSPAGIAPAFSPAVTDYTLSVSYATTKLVVSATPNHEKAWISTTGASDLKVGENIVKVVCTAESGATKTYTIKVTRRASEHSGATVTMNGMLYSVAHELENLSVPAGFIQTESTYAGRKILTFKSQTGELYIAWLSASQGSGAWYVYNASNDSFTPYTAVTPSPGSFVLLDMPAGIVIPEGFAAEATPMEILGVSANAYAATAEGSEFYLVYAMGPNGQAGFHIFDKAQGTLQRYFTAGDVQVMAPIDGEETDKPDKDVNIDEPSPKQKLITYGLMGVAVLLLVCGIVILVVILKKNNVNVSNEDDEE